MVSENIAMPLSMCRMPYSFSAFIHLSAIIPKIAGINTDAMPNVEKTAPNSDPPHFLFSNQKTPIVINQAPQIMNCRKFMIVSLNFNPIIKYFKIIVANLNNSLIFQNNTLSLHHYFCSIYKATLLTTIN